MFIVLLIALASADADLGLGNLLLDASGLVPVLPAAQLHTVNWQIPVAPNHITINAGDSVQFTWTGFHGVVMFTDSNGASTCAVNLASTMSAPADGGLFIWQANTPGEFYFACPVGDHCMQGMQLWVSVIAPIAIPIDFGSSLAINWGPVCSVCGASCLMTLSNTFGVCNANFNCVARRLLPPICANGCPILSCGIAPLCLAPELLFNPTDINGCPMCPTCTSTPCIGLACLPCCPQVVPLGSICRQCSVI